MRAISCRLEGERLLLRLPLPLPLPALLLPALLLPLLPPQIALECGTAKLLSWRSSNAALTCQAALPGVAVCRSRWAGAG